VSSVVLSFLRRQLPLSSLAVFINLLRFPSVLCVISRTPALCTAPPPRFFRMSAHLRYWIRPVVPRQRDSSLHHFFPFMCFFSTLSERSISKQSCLPPSECLRSLGPDDSLPHTPRQHPIPTPSTNTKPPKPPPPTHPPPHPTWR